jgi:hypothetical protein
MSFGRAVLTRSSRSERREEWVRSVARVVQPEPGEFHPRMVPEHMIESYFEPNTLDLKPEKAVDLKRDYTHRGLQVIVKLANIQLTPERPEYEGGTWHVEGQLVSSHSYEFISQS